MNLLQAAADTAWFLEAAALTVAVGAGIALLAWATWRTTGTVRDRIEEARMRHTIRRLAARNPFDDPMTRAADTDHTTHCTCDQPAIDTRPGTDQQALADLNALYRAPSWKEQR